MADTRRDQLAALLDNLTEQLGAPLMAGRALAIINHEIANTAATLNISEPDATQRLTTAHIERLAARVVDRYQTLVTQGTNPVPIPASLVLAACEALGLSLTTAEHFHTHQPDPTEVGHCILGLTQALQVAGSAASTAHLPRAVLAITHKTLHDTLHQLQDRSSHGRVPDATYDQIIDRLTNTVEALTRAAHDHQVALHTDT